MTVYTTHADSLFDPDAPILGSTHLEARDNLISVAEGDASAPSILEGAIAGGAAGAIGTYALAQWVGPSTPTDVDFGDTVAGADLFPCSITVAGGNADSVNSSATSLTGTWRLMSRISNVQISTGDYVVMALRIL